MNELCAREGGCTITVQNPNKLSDFDYETAQVDQQRYVKMTGTVVLSECSHMCNYITTLHEAAKEIVDEGGTPVAAVRVEGVRQPRVAYITKNDTTEIR